MSYLSVSSYSLHRLLGPLRWTVWDDIEKKHVIESEPQPDIIDLLDLPGILATKGFKALEICHFHFPSTETDYLQKLKGSFEKANITFYTLLLDYGDISSEDEIRRQA